MSFPELEFNYNEAHITNYDATVIIIYYYLHFKNNSDMSQETTVPRQVYS